MRQCRDTFLRLLSDNLTGVPVHNVRRDSVNPSANRYQVDCVNVKFLDVSPNKQIASTLVEIAICASEELVALGWVKKVFDILSSAYLTPKLDYTVPSSPTGVHSNIFWDTDITFRTVQNDFYYDYRCLVSLHHRVDS